MYVAESKALAALELLVHLNASQILDSYVMIPVDFAEELVRTVDPAALPENWRTYPTPPGNQAVGDAWAAHRESVVLALPSADVEGETIFLINPNHPNFAQLDIAEAVAFTFDERLVKEESLAQHLRQRRDRAHRSNPEDERPLHQVADALLDLDFEPSNNAVYLVADFLESTTDPYYGGEVDYGDRAEHCWNGDHSRANAYSRLRYPQMFIPRIMDQIRKNHPAGADTTSWRY